MLPFGYYPFYYGSDRFYFSDGLFYKQYDKEYKVVVPPVGAEVPTLPTDSKEVVINGQTYYESKGVYYSSTQNAEGKQVYVVAGKDGVLNTDGKTVYVNPVAQIGDIVDQLPEDSREILIKGDTYYVSPDGVYYEKLIDGNKITYKVIGLDNEPIEIEK